MDRFKLGRLKLNRLRRLRARLARLRYVRDLLALRRNARLYLLSVLLGGLGNSVFFLFFNLYVLSLGESKQFLGLLQSLPSMLVLIVGIPAGMIGDRLGRRPALLIGGSVGLLANLGFLTFPGRPLMIFWMAIQGMANALYWLNIAPFLAQNSSQKERAFLFSADWSLATLAGFVGSLVAGGLPAALALRMDVGPESAEAYRAAMYAGVGLKVLALVPIWLTREARWPGSREASPLSLGRILNLKAPVARLLLPNLLIGLGAALLIPYMNLFFKERFPIDDRALGTIFAPRDLFTAVASMAGPALALRLGKVRSIVFTEAASLVFLLIIGFVPVLPIAVVGFWMRGALMNMGQPLYVAFMMEQSPQQERATVNSIVEMAWQVGWIVGPAISGAVQAQAGFAPLFLATSTLYALAAGLTFFFFRTAEAELLGEGKTEIMV